MANHEELAQLDREATRDWRVNTALRQIVDADGMTLLRAPLLFTAEDLINLDTAAAARNALPGLLAERAQLRAALGALAAAYLAEERRASWATRVADAARDCAAYLEAMVEAYYAGLPDYPSMQADYARDMLPVVALRAALGEEPRDA